MLLVLPGLINAQELHPTKDDDLVQGVLQNERYNPVRGVIEFYDAETNEGVKRAKIEMDGRFQVLLPKSRSYFFRVKKGRFLYYFSEAHFVFRTSGEDRLNTINIDLTIHQYDPGTKIVLEGMQFAPQSAELTNRHKASLRFLAKFLVANPSMIVQIGGHTDNAGTREKNISLSTDRAVAAMTFLIDECGIEPERLSAIGYGNSLPLLSNDTERGRKMNRRTSFVIIKN